ncbi:MAG: hypothetical protein KGI37_06140 [Alphaproteobacteria bacterium]|nr:hypothetical protein [Alphaproteobacteria bacterium]
MTDHVVQPSRESKNLFSLPEGGSIVFDFDDVFFPSDNGTHARIKALITQSVIRDLGDKSILATRDAHGHLPYFPQYVLYKYIETGRDADSPEFIEAMEKCYFGDNGGDPEHYRNIGPAPELYEQLSRLQSEGVNFVILTSGPYNPHVQRVLARLSTERENIEAFFPRENIYDITRMCALYDDVSLDDFQNPTHEKLLRWLKPQRENYLAMMHQAGLQPGVNLYFEDNDVNGSKGSTAAPMPEGSLCAFAGKFGLTSEQAADLACLSDAWGWINLAGKKLRDGSRPPALEVANVVDALKLVRGGRPHALAPKIARGSMPICPY